jgi:hypothetical protein
VRCLSLRRKFASRPTLGPNPSQPRPLPLAPISYPTIHIRRRTRCSPLARRPSVSFPSPSPTLFTELAVSRPFARTRVFPPKHRIPDFSISRISRTVARVHLSRSVEPYRCSGISRSRVISAFVSDVRLLCPTSVSNSTISFYRRRRRRRPLCSSSRRRESRSNPARATNRRRVVKTRGH